MFRLTSLATALLSLFMLSAPASAYEAITGPLGLLAYDKAKAYDGYTLFTPHTKVSSWIVDKIQDPGSRKTYLIDMEGNIVHTWKHDHPAFYAELLPNGNLLRAEKIAGSPVNFGGWYGLLREYAWDGKVVWEYKVSNPRQIAHHGFDRLPNGNTAILIWENKTYDEALAKGRDPKDKALSRNGMPAPGQGPDGQPLQGIWPDAILEVTPKGEIAWEWHVWDNIGTGPDQIDINWHLPLSMGYFARADWTHWNSVRYNAKTDQYAVNSRDFGEIYIIDRKTKKIVWRLPATTTTAIRCFSARTTWSGCPTATFPSSTTARIAPAPTAAPSWKSIPPPIRWSGSTKPRITTVSIPTSSQRPRNSPTATGSSPLPTTGIFSKSPRTSRWSGNTTIPSPPTIRPIA